MVDTKGDRFSFGCELEVSDWDARKLPPPGWGRSPDHTIVNSNGVAAQPSTKVYGFGGELNSPPSDSVDDQVALVCETLDSLRPSPAVNYRSNFHVHVRVPGLKDSLTHLKAVQRYVHDSMPSLLPVIEPIPQGGTPAERKRARRRKVSHHTLLTPHRLKHQLDAGSVKEFFEREVPATKAGGKPMWHAQPRLCVGLRQLLQTDTVEFRHFPGTLDPFEIAECFAWCQQFVLNALSGAPTTLAYAVRCAAGLPAFPDFCEWQEVYYQSTADQGVIGKAEISRNIASILEGDFDGTEEFEQARARAGCVPR